MRLRWRVILAFFVTTVAVLGASSTATYSLFASAEVRELDRELTARVQHEVDNLEHSAGLMTVVQGTYLRFGALDDHVKFAALYDDKGALIARSQTFTEVVPARSDLTAKPKQAFDFGYGERRLRGILWPLPEGLLLLAASRAALDDDLRSLSRLLLALFVAGSALSLVLAGALGTSLTKDIEHLATVARRIAAGELDLRLGQRSGHAASEVRTLINDTNAMVDSLQSALAAEQRFVSNAAHELRSPLTVLSGEIELSLRRERTVDQYKQALADALENTRALQRLSEDLLDLARTRLTPLLPAVVCDLSDAVNAALRLLCVGAPQVSAEVPHLIVRGHKDDLTRLFRNLIENAIEHTPKDAVVRVRAHSDEAWAQIDIEDDGAGVALELRARIFEPFVRGGEERARSGAGLGLAIAHEIALASGGSLTLASAHVPTRFCVRLPVAT